ncbi:MAG: SulP family inorganic anion transporter [Bdellovibrionia bacterium]
MNLRQFPISDLRSGFYASLIALPLSLGIAAASGFPPITGIFAAIIGGIICSAFGSSPLTIKGPAAGLIVIAISAVQELGMGDLTLGYHRALAAGAAAGVLQVILALCGAGRLGSIMPPSVVHGMLAGIGVIICSKQIHVLLGVIPSSKTPLALISEVPNSIINEEPFIALLGAITLLGLIIFPKLKYFKSFPAALLNLFIVVPLGFALHLGEPHQAHLLGHWYTLGPDYLVHIPTHALASITFPDWTALKTLLGWKFVIMFALVGSIESLLTVSAVDSLDPEKRTSNLDRDLLSVGIGNLMSSLIGGLPMISEIVRSKANIDNGAKTVFSNVFHGIFLLLAITTIPYIINAIPLSSLAAMLVITGFRLASPKEFIKVYKVGLDQFALFSVTMLVTLFSNLLSGVFIGILLEVIFHLIRGAKPINFINNDIERSAFSNEHMILIPKGPCVFSNLPKLQDIITLSLQSAQSIAIDFSKSKLVDHTTLNRLQSLKRMHPHHKFQLSGLDTMKGVSPHELATRFRS